MKSLNTIYLNNFYKKEMMRLMNEQTILLSEIKISLDDIITYQNEKKSSFKKFLEKLIRKLP